MTGVQTCALPIWLYEGQKNAGIVAIGIINPEKKVYDTQEPFIGFNLHIPGLLSLMANRSFGSFVPGMKDLVYGNTEHDILGAAQKMELGKKAVTSLDAYKQARKAEDTAAAEVHLAAFNEKGQIGDIQYPAHVLAGD